MKNMMFKSVTVAAIMKNVGMVKEVVIIQAMTLWENKAHTNIMVDFVSAIRINF